MKRNYPDQALDDIGPKFNYQFDEVRHEKLLYKTLKVGHLPRRTADRLTALVKKYWPVLRQKGDLSQLKIMNSA